MLEGDLADFTLPDILRLLAVTSKTGRLRLDGVQASGRVDLIDGHVRDASSDAERLPLARRLLGQGIIDGADLTDLLGESGQLPTDRAFAREVVRGGHADAATVAEVLREQTVDAVFDLLRWKTGSFRVDIGGDRDTSPPDLAVTIDELLEEADHRIAAWPAIEAATGAGDAVVTIARPRGSDGSAELDIDPDAWALLAFVDSRRTVDELVALSGRGQFDARRTLGGLVDRGVVRVGEAGTDGTVQRLLAAHAALADIEVSRASRFREPVISIPTAPKAPDRDSVTSKPAPTKKADEPPPARSVPDDFAADGVTPLRTRVRSGRLTTDPSVDAELVNRLIEGVEGL